MNQPEGDYTGDHIPSDGSVTAEQVQVLHTGLTSLIERSLRDDNRGPDLQMESYSFRLDGRTLPHVISRHFIEPPNDELTEYLEPTYEFYVGRPDEGDEEYIPVDSQDEKYICWVSFVKVSVKSNGTMYRSTIDYYLAADGHQQDSVTLTRETDIEKDVGAWIIRIADQLYDNWQDGSDVALAENEDVIESLENPEDLVDVQAALEEREYVELMGRCIMAGLLEDHGLRGELPDTAAKIDGLEDLDETGIGIREANAVTNIVNALSLTSQLGE